MAKVFGLCDDRFQQVKELLQQYLTSGEELGASLVVNIDGENVVDLWGGYADTSRTRPWEEDTITAVWSTSKTVTSLATLILIDRGLVSPYEKVAKYWPEFAANGKQNIEVRHIISHTSGVSGWDARMSIEDVIDVPASTALLEQQAPWWVPGTASGYHSFTMGHLVGEVVRRVTGKSLKQFIADEIATPLGADFQLGVAEKDWPRTADVVPPSTWRKPPPAGDVDSVSAKTMRNPVFEISIANTPTWRQAELGAASGFGNARAVARMLSAISLGGRVGNHKLLSSDTIDRIFEEQAKGIDLATGEALRFGIGYGLTGADTMVNWMPEGRVCFWGGLGGSIVIMDVDRRMTISYVMNKMENVGIGNYRTKQYVRAIYNAYMAL